VLEEVIRRYRALPERQRQTFVSVVRAAADALAGSAKSAEEPDT
jgi:hypothetical protein